MNSTKQTHTPLPAFKIEECQDFAEDLKRFIDLNGANLPAQIALKDGERVQWLCNQHTSLVEQNRKLREALTKIACLHDGTANTHLASTGS